MPAIQRPRNGIQIGPGVGKGRYRVRQSLVVDHYAPLISARAYGAVKLDMLLRCIALSPDHAGKRRQPGLVLRDWRYEDLHDLVEPAPEVRTATTGRTDQEVVKLKRKWVAFQLKKLQARQLVKIMPRPGTTPQLIMLCDDGLGGVFDDPGAVQPGVPYFTVQGTLIASGELLAWRAPEVAAYFACLLGELHADRGANRPIRPGHESWWRPLTWFATDQWAPSQRTLLPFSTSLLEQGIASLRDRQMIKVKRVMIDPRTGRRLARPRNMYSDQFDRFESHIAFNDIDALFAQLDAQNAALAIAQR
jgi:hypothetical protein